MNREIKFRLWSKVAQQMIPWEMVKEKPYTIFDWVNYIPMQYIGVKDVNGVDIYEGDKYICSWGFAVAVEWKKSDSIQSSGHGESDRKIYSGFCLGSCPSKIEIVGNIYE